jgi:hypothetical protein
VVNGAHRPVYPREKDWVHIVQETVWTPGPVWTGAANVTSTGIRSSDRPVRSDSLYRLRCPGPDSPYCNECLCVSALDTPD